MLEAARRCVCMCRGVVVVLESWLVAGEASDHTPFILVGAVSLYVISYFEGQILLTDL